MSQEWRPHALFIGLAYAGNTPRFMTLRANTENDDRIRPQYGLVEGWHEGGWIERLDLLPAPVRGRLRGMLSARVLATLPRPDVIWSAANEVTLPWLWSQVGPLRRPLVLDLDATGSQLERMAMHYRGRAPRRGVRREANRRIERLVWSRVSHFTPWSTWAADGLRAEGVPGDRITVLPPGVDVDYWAAPPRSAPVDRPIRLLFVGGDFDRKGGRLLVEALREARACRFELDIVTRDQVEEGAPGVRIHRAEPGSSLLRDLYARADAFILPTRAECFGIAVIEAMAAGLPAVMGDVGGARDIIDDGANGWLIDPTPEGVREALCKLGQAREVLPGMGAHAREKAVRCFNGRMNDSRLVELMCAEAESRRGHRVRRTGLHSARS